MIERWEPLPSLRFAHRGNEGADTQRRIPSITPGVSRLYHSSYFIIVNPKIGWATELHQRRTKASYKRNRFQELQFPVSFTAFGVYFRFVFRCFSFMFSSLRILTSYCVSFPFSFYLSSYISFLFLFDVSLYAFIFHYLTFLLLFSFSISLYLIYWFLHINSGLFCL